MCLKPDGLGLQPEVERPCPPGCKCAASRMPELGEALAEGSMKR